MYYIYHGFGKTDWQQRAAELRHTTVAVVMKRHAAHQEARAVADATLDTLAIDLAKVGRVWKHAASQPCLTGDTFNACCCVHAADGCVLTENITFTQARLARERKRCSG